MSKKILSFILALALSLTICVPACAQSKSSNNISKQNTVSYQQRVNSLKKVNEGLKNAPGWHAKLNQANQLELYTDKVAKINEKAAMSSGLVYGPWFGGSDSYYEMSPTETMQFVLTINAILSPILSCSANATYAAASYIASMIGYVIPVQPGQWVKADRPKTYREVKYSDGTFAYFQTKIGASCSLDDSYLGYGEAIISGGMW